MKPQWICLNCSYICRLCFLFTKTILLVLIYELNIASKNDTDKCWFCMWENFKFDISLGTKFLCDMCLFSLCLFSVCLSLVSINERRHYICNIFSHWSKLCSLYNGKQALIPHYILWCVLITKLKSNGMRYLSSVEFILPLVFCRRMIPCSSGVMEWNNFCHLTVCNKIVTSLPVMFESRICYFELIELTWIINNITISILSNS